MIRKYFDQLRALTTQLPPPLFVAFSCAIERLENAIPVDAEDTAQRLDELRFEVAYVRWQLLNVEHPDSARAQRAQCTGNPAMAKKLGLERILQREAADRRAVARWEAHHYDQKQST